MGEMTEPFLHDRKKHNVHLPASQLSSPQTLDYNRADQVSSSIKEYLLSTIKGPLKPIFQYWVEVQSSNPH